MQVDVTTLDAKKAGSIELDESVFGLTPRADILQQAVRWQLAKRRAGTHATRTKQNHSASTAKIYRQKGTGRARHGSRKANVFVGGVPAFGPQPRDHGFKLPKKVRRLALKNALSAKQAEGKLVVLDKAELKEAKAKALAAQLDKLGWESALVIAGDALSEEFVRAASNLRRIDVLPAQGANVYDILNHDTLVLTKDAVEQLEARLKDE